MSRFHESSSSFNVNSGVRCYLPPMCYYNRFDVVYTSNTRKNPNKKFYGCPYFKEGKMCCVKFFCWVEDWEKNQVMMEDNMVDHRIDMDANLKEIKMMIKDHVNWSRRVVVLGFVFNFIACFFMLCKLK